MDDKDERLEVFDQPDIEAPPVPEMPDVDGPDAGIPDADAPTTADAPDTQSPGHDFGDHSKDEGF